MKQILYITLLIFSSFVKSQTISIQNSHNNKPLQDVLLYSNGQYLGITNEQGLFTLPKNNYSKSDTIVLNKNNFETKKIKFSELTSKINLDSIYYKEIQEVTIYKLDNNKLLEKIKINLNNNFYNMWKSGTAYWQFLNSLSSNNEKFLYYNDIFVSVKNKGIYTAKLTNLINNSKVVEIFDNKYKQKYYIYKNKYIFKYPFIFYPNHIVNDETILDFLKNPKKYYYKIKSIGNNKVIIYISKENYNGTMIVDTADFGIYQYSYDLKNFEENSDNYKDQKSQKYFVTSKKVDFNYEKVNNNYYYKSSSVDMNFISKKDNVPFVYTLKRNAIEPININQLRKINIFTLTYEE